MWNSPASLIASSPRLNHGQSYEGFFKSLQKWAKPYFQECYRMRVQAFDGSLLERRYERYFYVLRDWLPWWKPDGMGMDYGFPWISIGLDPTKKSAHLYTEECDDLFIDGFFNTRLACKLYFDADYKRQLPPPPVLRWLREGLSGIENGESADESFGIVKKPDRKKNVPDPARKRERDLGYGRRMALLTDLGLTISAAAEIVVSQDDNYARHFGEPEHASKIDADSIAKYWKTDWKTRFEEEFKAEFLNNPTYIAMRDAGEITFYRADSSDDFFNADDSCDLFGPICGAFTCRDLCFPSATLKLRKMQGLSVKVK